MLEPTLPPGLGAPGLPGPPGDQTPRGTPDRRRAAKVTRKGAWGWVARIPSCAAPKAEGNAALPRGSRSGFARAVERADGQVEVRCCSSIFWRVTIATL